MIAYHVPLAGAALNVTSAVDIELLRRMLES
jgi:hypothetical protein